MKQRLLVFGIFALAAGLSANAEMLDRPSGIKIGQRMTLRPYVSFMATYDSNVNSSHNNEEGDMMWTISPTLGVEYRAETWSLLLDAYYNYHAYTKTETTDNNAHNFGESLRYRWSNAEGAGEGWSLMLNETFRQTAMSDEMSLADGRGYTSDNRQFDISGAVQRRFNDYWHGDLNAGYYWLDYLNDTKQANSYYGWQRWNVGAEAGFAPSPWTDFIIAGGYQGYTQDNTDPVSSGRRQLDDSSQGFTVQAGIGSFMTERISYRLLAGWSRFEYADGERTDDGFVYTASGQWKIGETWNMMLLASSYYQPSERQNASSARVDALSWGLVKTMIRGKLRANLDIQYRRETIESVYDDSNTDYTLDITTGRLGFTYSLNRFVSMFVNGEYQLSVNDESDSRYGAYDYDRWRVSCGFTLTY